MVGFQTAALKIVLSKHRIIYGQNILSPSSLPLDALQMTQQRKQKQRTSLLGGITSQQSIGGGASMSST